MMNQVNDPAAAAEHAAPAAPAAVSGADGAQPAQIGPHCTRVRLVCGREVSSASEEWRVQCEAFHRLRQFAAGADLTEVLNGVEKKRGADAATSLRQRMVYLEPYFLLDRVPDRAQRRSYLDKVEARRGLSVRQTLEGRVVALWESRRQ